MPVLLPTELSCELLIVPDWVWAIYTILQEARSEPLEGQIAVAEVIHNRMKQKFFSNGTFRDTCLRPYQFSGWNTNDPNRIICAGFSWTSPSTMKALSAFDKVFVKKEIGITKGAVLYHASTMETFPNWANEPSIIKTVEIGRHIFYKREGIE